MQEYTKQALERYVEEHVDPGGFLKAVLSNDLTGAFSRADSYNERHMKEIVTYVYNYMPINCWGDKETVKRWLAK